MFTLCDCRNDKYYNEKFLKEEDSLKVVGYDACVETGIYQFFNNIDRYKTVLKEVGIDCDELDMELLRLNLDEIPEDAVSTMNSATNMMLMLKKCIFGWAEIQRNGMIVSLIDDDEDKEQHKQEVEDGNRENAIIRERKKREDYLSYIY